MTCVTPRGWRCVRDAEHPGLCALIPKWWNYPGKWWSR